MIDIENLDDLIDVLQQIRNCHGNIQVGITKSCEEGSLDEFDIASGINLFVKDVFEYGTSTNNKTLLVWTN